jgi:hypothetical protein
MKDSLDNVPLFSDLSDSENEESPGVNPTVAVAQWVCVVFLLIVRFLGPEFF